MKKVTAVGLDLAKTVFQVHGADEDGRAVLRKTLRRGQVAEFFAQLSPFVVGMEACGSAHSWARKFREMGHEVRLIAPQYVKPFVKRNKTDPADAEAICEAMGRPGMRFVASSVDMPVVGAKGEARASCGNVRDPEYRFGQ